MIGKSIVHSRGNDTQPTVSVVMAVYNGRRYLRQAVESILNQTFRDFEFIVVDDGSTDETANELYTFTDPRLRILHNRENIGLTCSLNRALKVVQAPYVARMDADDVAQPQRLARQVQYLEEHPEVGLLGSAFELIDQDSVAVGLKMPPTDHDSLCSILLLENPLCHSSVMYRRELVEAVGGYDERYQCAQDYDLWLRFSRVSRVACLTDMLVQFRVGAPGSVTVSQIARQQAAAEKISTQAVRDELTRVHVELDVPAYQRYRWTLDGKPSCQPGDTDRLMKLWRFLANRPETRTFWGGRLALAARQMMLVCPAEARRLTVVLCRYFLPGVPLGSLWRTVARSLLPVALQRRIPYWRVS